MTKYPVVEVGEWVQPRRTRFQLACCDCCLVHVLSFRIVRGKIQFKATRDNRKTAALRRYRLKRR